MTGFRGKTFGIPITRVVDGTRLGWPSPEERRSETLGGNRDYSSIGRVTWAEVNEAIEEEREAIDRLSDTDDPESAYEEWVEACYEEPFLFGYDLGTNALSAALAATRCLPFYSCNGGAFGGSHNDAYPLVAFFCRPAVLPFVNAAAEKASVGLEYNHANGLNAFAQNVDSLIGMAAALFESRSEINSIRTTPLKSAKKDDGEQGSLL